MRLKGLSARVLETGWLLLAGLVMAVGCDNTPDGPPPPQESTCLEHAHFGDPALSLYVLPYPVGTAYSVLQSYCESWSHGNQLAYDFEMAIGTPVTAARGGVIMMVVDMYQDSDRDPLHFNYVMIRHDDGTVGFYAHFRLGSIVVRQNDTVTTGQFIANSGSSGTPIADLHFGVYQSWPPRESYDVPVNFRNAQGALDERGGLRRGVVYLALPY